MACVTLKRSLDHDATPTTSSKRRRFHCGSGARSPHSQQQQQQPQTPLTFVPPPASPASSCPTAAQSAQAFPASRLSPEQLSLRLTAEVKRLQRRRLLTATGNGAARGRSPEAAASASDAEMSPNASSASGAVAAAAAAAAAAASCSNCGCPTTARSSAAAAAAASSEPALFSLSQVQAIAEKLLLEREDQVRAEFQALLSAKLQEQYDAFLRFNHDQLYRLHSATPMSYVS